MLLTFPLTDFDNIRMIFKVLGVLLLMESIFMFSCIPFALYYQETYRPLLISGIITLGSGLVLWLLTQKGLKISILSCHFVMPCLQ